MPAERVREEHSPQRVEIRNIGRIAVCVYASAYCTTLK